MNLKEMDSGKKGFVQLDPIQLDQKNKYQYWDKWALQTKFETAQFQFMLEQGLRFT